MALGEWCAWLVVTDRVTACVAAERIIATLEDNVKLRRAMCTCENQHAQGYTQGSKRDTRTRDKTSARVDGGLQAERE